MKHRHLDLAEGVYSAAAVHSVLERGGASDVFDLLAALRADPFGPTARAVEQAIATSKVYGYPELLRACLDRFRADHEGRRAPPS